MQAKLKECVGAGSKGPHPAYIFKRIEGKPYCKQCSFYLNPSKPLARTGTLSSKPKVIDKEKLAKQWDFFLKIWEKRNHVCEECNNSLGNEPRSYMFDHLLEKSQYQNLAFEESNIFLCCLSCHANKTGGFPGPKHTKAIEDKLLSLVG